MELNWNVVNINKIEFLERNWVYIYYFWGSLCNGELLVWVWGIGFGIEGYWELEKIFIFFVDL